MLHIDGSYGEGGGQIIRTAIALSVLTNTPIHLHHIRAKRPKPGLQAQHYTAISCMKTLCEAKTEGADLGSSEVTFIPGTIRPGKYSFDIGTAGSMILVFQSCILCLLHAPSPITIRLTGGSDVKWAPSWDYFTFVFLQLLHRMGVQVDAQLDQRGYYPKGGGQAVIRIHPQTSIRPLHLCTPSALKQIQGNIHLAGLPEHIATRMKHTIQKICIPKDISPSLNIEKATAVSEGTGVTLWASSDQAVLGSTVPGERGVSAEKIGEQAVQQLVQEIQSGSTIDLYGCDQLIPYLAFASSAGHSCVLVRFLSQHAKTNMWLVQQFFEKKFEITKQHTLFKIKI